MELENQKAREEMEREEEEMEKAGKEGGGKREVAVAAEIIRGARKRWQDR